MEESWFNAVVALAKSYGYSAQRVMMFSMDIQECYDKGMTPETCVEVVF